MPIDPARSVLLTDLYELTMLSGYYRYGMFETAVFDFFVRKLPPCRNFLLVAGLEQVIQYLTDLRFREEDLEWVAKSGCFTSEFIKWLSKLRFTGDVDAVPEGTIVFAEEPIIRVTAPLPEAQLVESRLMNLAHFQTLIASKAARCVLAAPDKLLVDFGMRRAHGAEAAVFASRANYIAGFAGTATVAAGALFGIPVFGTMAHSFVQVHDDELTAFEHFVEAQPDNVVLLIDTYDTEAAARKVVALAPRLRERGIRVRGVRIDSGDLVKEAYKVRHILDAAGEHDITIFASSSIDEYRIAEFERAGAPIDGYGVGSHLDTSSDRPFLDCAYKIAEYAGIPRRKRSEGKATWPGRKQVYRRFDGKGKMLEDCVAVEGDTQPGEPLLLPVMRKGKRVSEVESLEVIRARVKDSLASLPKELCGVDKAPRPYPVKISDSLRALAAKTDSIILSGSSK